VRKAPDESARIVFTDYTSAEATSLAHRIYIDGCRPRTSEPALRVGICMAHGMAPRGVSNAI
jgi:hypothetical protein